MKKVSILFLALATVVTGALGQDKPASPKEEVSGKVGSAKVDIVYCRPSARGRKVMGSLVPYGDVWRTGANAATTITFDKAVKIEGKDLPAGTYALFTIPNESEWVIIFNKTAKQMGAFNYKESEDALRVKVKPGKTAAFVEMFTISTDNSKVHLAWENTDVAFAVK